MALDMSLAGKGRLLQAERSRTLIYVSQRLVADSAFPFQPGDPLEITIDPSGEHLVVKKTRKEP